MVPVMKPEFPTALQIILNEQFNGKQAALAAISGVDASLISRYLSGAKVPDQKSLDAIVKDAAKDLTEAFLNDQVPRSMKRMNKVSLAAPAALGKGARAAAACSQ